MFRIGPFSKLVRVSPRTLRHYEKCGLFFPAKVDSENGYRLYGADQIALIQRIVSLRDMGFHTQEIGEVLEHGSDPAWLTETLRQRAAAIEAELEGQKHRLSLVRGALQQMKENTVMAEYKVEVKEISAVRIISARQVLPSYYDEGDLWHKLAKFIKREGLVSSVVEGCCYSEYHDPDYKKQDVDVEVGHPWSGKPIDQDGITVRELEAIPLAACVTFDGPYELTGEATAHLAKWVEENGYEIIGNSRGTGIRHPGNEADPQHYQTQVSFPVRKI
ncbi:MerR family transcriptional regulator [Ruminococcaceae bacterium OttesenSCG-928-L11]|nr:MerR family transcriptional regulator [Ruminococcaceae bacterium OttesenSCG-928-L11]